MAAEVILTVTRGQPRGKRYVFKARNMCTIGRGKDCLIHLPDDENHRMISRHHCVLDIAPPHVRVRDLGSRNGTFVNGEKIGQREPGQVNADAFPESDPVDLEDGDDLRVGHVTLHVTIVTPARCALCEGPVPDADREAAEWAHGIFVCETCRNKGESLEKLSASHGSAAPA